MLGALQWKTTSVPELDQLMEQVMITEKGQMWHRISTAELQEMMREKVGFQTAFEKKKGV